MPATSLPALLFSLKPPFPKASLVPLATASPVFWFLPLASPTQPNKIPVNDSGSGFGSAPNSYVFFPTPPSDSSPTIHLNADIL